MEERNCITHSFNILCELLDQSCFEFRQVHVAVLVARILRITLFWNYIEKWGYSPTRDDNKLGSLMTLTVTGSYFVLELHPEVGILSHPWRQPSGVIGDFDSYWTRLALNFDKSTS
ncbi:hypothetical protein V1477_007938 [Vespula maculifrons]|uniref:Uncharacterized protein n=1 Tax=Vespula maculifrons TaxID=7453 RepID=A0ABD2CG83_VESMC